MGMSASQCRLLTLTARMSDLEYRAQSVSNSKLQLATKSDAIARDYSAALDKKKLTVLSSYDTSTGTPNYIDATAYNLTTYNAISPLDKQRFLQDSDNKVLISENIKAAFESSNGNLEEFLNSLGYTSSDYYASQFSEVFGGNIMRGLIEGNAGACYDDLVAAYLAGDQTVMNIAGQMLSQMNGEVTPSINDLNNFYTTNYNANLGIVNDSGELIDNNNSDLGIIQILTIIQSGGTQVPYENLEKLGDKLLALDDMFSEDNIKASAQLAGVSDEDADAIEYYANVFNQIQQYGYSCPGDANMKDSEWLYAQLTAGNVHLSIFNRALNEGEGGFSEIPWKTGDASLKIDDDDSTLAKAEAEYNIKTSEIQSIDKRYDLQLKQIDTEHSALQTEYDAVKKVVDKNIELSFKAFG